MGDQPHRHTQGHPCMHTHTPLSIPARMKCFLRKQRGARSTFQTSTPTVLMGHRVGGTPRTALRTCSVFHRITSTEEKHLYCVPLEDEPLRKGAQPSMAPHSLQKYAFSWGSGWDWDSDSGFNFSTGDTLANNFVLRRKSPLHSILALRERIVGNCQ